MVPAFTLIVVALVGVITVATIPETKGTLLLHESDVEETVDLPADTVKV